MPSISDPPPYPTPAQESYGHVRECPSNFKPFMVEPNWNVMAHGDAREEKWRGNKRMEWVTSKRHMTAEHRRAPGVQTLQADAHTSPASSRLNWRPRRFKLTHPFRRKTKSDFCVCTITFQKQSTKLQNVRLPYTSRTSCNVIACIHSATCWELLCKHNPLLLTNKTKALIYFTPYFCTCVKSKQMAKEYLTFRIIFFFFINRKLENREI